MKQSEIDLVEAVKRGSDAAFEELYHQYYKLAFYYAYRLCKNEADAKDIVQDSFIEIHRSISSLKESAYFKAWMYRVVTSKCKKMFRKNKYSSMDLEQNALVYELVEERLEYLPELNAHYHHDQDVLNALIDRLPEGQRAMIILFYLEQMSLKEISDILDIPIGTVKSRLSYAREYLRKAMMLYQKKHHVKVNFHDVDTLIATTLSSVCASSLVPMVKPGMRWRHALQHHTILVKGMICSLAVTTVTAGAGMYHSWKTQNESKEQQLQSAVNEQPRPSFQPISLDGEIIRTPQDGYFELISWACCEEMLNEKKSDISVYLPLYEEMKQYGGPFYERLVKQHWSSSFEKLQNK